MGKRIFILILFLLIITGCSTAQDKSFYDPFKNPDLEYNWEFNSSLKPGGHTYNSTYFEIRPSFFGEKIEYPLEVTFKHEEGHIYANQLLQVNDWNGFLENKAKELRIDDKDFKNYGDSVSEGIAVYYAWNYFNSSISQPYCEYVKEDTEKSHYYTGFSFVIFSLEEGIYSNLDEIIIDLGSVKQYEMYNKFVENFTGTQCLKN